MPKFFCSRDSAYTGTYSIPYPIVGFKGQLHGKQWEGWDGRKREERKEWGKSMQKKERDLV